MSGECELDDIPKKEGEIMPIKERFRVRVWIMANAALTVILIVVLLCVAYATDWHSLLGIHEAVETMNGLRDEGHELMAAATGCEKDMRASQVTLRLLLAYAKQILPKVQNVTV